MASILRVAALAATLLATFAAPLFAQAKGIPPEWDLRKNLAQLSEEVKRLKPILTEVNAKNWVSAGAPETYVAQQRSAMAEIDYLVGSTEKLAKNPEKLTLALEALFRMESVEALVGSLTEGVRRYQNPALADLLRSTLTANANSRERLRAYIVDLASIREQEFDIANREAQRCRTELSKQTPAGARTKPQKLDDKKQAERK
jgi:hypothetical protein